MTHPVTGFKALAIHVWVYTAQIQCIQTLLLCVTCSPTPSPPCHVLHMMLFAVPTWNWKLTLSLGFREGNTSPRLIFWSRFNNLQLHLSTHLDLLLQIQDYFTLLFHSYKKHQLRTLNLRIKSAHSNTSQLNAPLKQKLHQFSSHLYFCAWKWYHSTFVF